MYRGVRNRKQLLAGLSLVLASVAMPALAHEAEADEPRATLSAEASSEVAQDTVEITLAAELSGASQTEVADALNQRLDSVMKQAKGHQGIEAAAGPIGSGRPRTAKARSPNGAARPKSCSNRAIFPPSRSWPPAWATACRSRACRSRFPGNGARPKSRSSWPRRSMHSRPVPRP